jgi:excisionase family DNA binding protein
MTHAGQDGLMNMKDLASLLGVTVRTIKRYDKSRKLPPCIRLGRLKRWCRAEVLQWLEQLRGGGANGQEA